MMHSRRRRIRSGHFGTFNRRDDGKREGLVTVKRSRGDKPIQHVSLNLSYVMYRPDLIQSADRKPLLIIHGGPSIPSDYLQPISHNMPDRCIIFYDQIGCGNSSKPKEASNYSIQNTVDDLKVLIAHLKLNQFHLYGHSFGGIVAYEYIKELNELQLHTPPLSPTAINTTPSEPELLSVTLCSVPSNVREIEVECKSLVASLKSTSNQRCESFDSYSSGDVSLEENSSSTYHDVFQNAFVCRSNDGTIPQPLQVAYSKKGEAWEGHEAIIDYVAQPLFNVGPCSKITRSPALLLRGEHDFISEKYGIDTWKQLLLLNYHKSVETQTFSGCAHYSMLENPGLHSVTLNSFLRSHEETMEHIQEVIAAQ